LDFDVGLRVANYKNMFFFVNDTVEQNKFNVLFDGGNTLVANPHFTLSYDNPGLFGIGATAGYTFYNTGDLDVAWHKPRFEMLFSGWYNIFDKVRLGAEMYVFGGIDALDTGISNDYASEAGKTRLPSVLDLNISAEYNFSRRYKAFVNLNNIFGKNYQYFLQYPNRGLQAMIGFSIDF
jgi:outer membrane receptor protein involved in Fe transport